MFIVWEQFFKDKFFKTKCIDKDGLVVFKDTLIVLSFKMINIFKNDAT